MKTNEDRTPRQEDLTGRRGARTARAYVSQKTRRVFTGLVLAATVMAGPWTQAAGPATVDLNSSAYFAILAGASITSTGSGIVNGDVGLNPGTSQGIPPAQVNGDIYVNEAVSLQAQADLTAAYNDAMGRITDRITVSGDIGNQTLPPGLYWSATSIGITGDLVLHGGEDDVWIFQVGSTLTTAAGVGPQSRVLLTGGAKAENVFWQVGSSATIGTYSQFKGTIMAQDSITLDTDSELDGRALARTGTVTFNGLSASIPPMITVVITAPADGYTYVIPHSVSIAVTAESTPYPIERVELNITGYLWSFWLGADYTEPYTFVWPEALAGDYVLVATAWDTEGNIAYSAPVTIHGSAPLWENAIKLGGDGWRWLDWFGYFEEDGYGWIWHSTHGWMYASGDTTAYIWFYTKDMGWLWTRDTLYPFLYRRSDRAWLWYMRGTKAPRWFYNFKTAKWEAR
jgi:hypothetical protein